jgi:molybdate transport system substrate-binding protein
MRSWCIAFAAFLLGTVSIAAHAQSEELVVFAAASLTDALNEIGRAYTAKTHMPVKYSFAASNLLARQIESGAPAQVFFSADTDWMDYLESRNLIQRSSRRDVVANRLVLIAPSTSAVALHIGPNFPLLAALDGGRLATGDPDSVPIGKYARTALISLGVWDDVAGRLVRADNVRTALNFVSRGEVPLGIVYETDARIDRGVRIVDVFPATTHAPITYPAAAVKGAERAADPFLHFLKSATAQRLFQKFGFLPVPTE